MAVTSPTVLVVDDDPAMRSALSFMFTDTGFTVSTHASGEEFLASLTPEMRGCVILDLKMPGMGGQEVHQRLATVAPRLAVIVLTGHGDVPIAVEEMKRGAFDFLSKPVNRNDLLRRVQQAIDHSLATPQDPAALHDLRDRYNTLSPREVQVLREVIQGRASKQIAHDLRLSVKTVDNHRASIMRKMEAVNAADLVRKAVLVGDNNA